MISKILLETAIADFYTDNDTPGAAMMVWQDGEIQTVARGISNLETGEPITPATNFRLASVTKQFTAACILQLRDRELLRLDQTLCDIFPEFPAYGGLVQIEHLLRHTSGVKDYEKLLPPDLEKQVTDADVLTMLAAQSTCDFIPGEQFRYSNSGYALLAMIVEAVSGIDFPAYLHEHIFKPADMGNTLAFVDAEGKPAPVNRAIGYRLDDNDKFQWADQNVTTAVLGDGGIYCSAQDYAKWITAYLGGRILKLETVKSALQPDTTTAGDPVPYGYGWRLELRDGHWHPYHPGSTSGFRNGALLDPSGKWAVAVFSNRSNGDALALAQHVAHAISMR